MLMPPDMDPNVRTVLADLNRDFYARFAGDFARTRRGWPPGFNRILPYLSQVANVLDLGCGNGRFMAFLAEHGWLGNYLGIDSSRQLLDAAVRAAEARVEPAGLNAHFSCLDLLDSDWPLLLSNSAPEAIVALAVLHHIPGAGQRARFLEACAGLLPTHGILVVSTWQFLSADRLRTRILPWETVGLTDADVETGDHLVSWGAGAAGRRYCAFIDRTELAREAREAGLELVEAFRTDGHEGNLNLYGIFRRTQRHVK
jgi:tRNA (uracil-5-)-methyltransferase TRM9